MPVTTTRPTEAQLEARINATLARVFPGVIELKHQLTYRLRVGRSVLDVGISDYVEGRADIMVYQRDRVLAVLELKREGLQLTQDDEEQGRSYALLMQAPILVITNGVETKIYQTHNMELIVGTSADAAEIAKRFEAAATSAQAGVSGAIAKLLGTDLASSAIAALTAAELEELTGDWSTGERFVRDFLVPRSATEEMKTVFREGRNKLIVLSGPPLSGKSSVLREIALKSGNEPWDVLYLDVGSCGEGLFRRLANALAMNFGWPASEDESRVWLRQLSTRPDRLLVLCLDSLQTTSTKLLSELEELLSTFGDNLRIAIAVDENDVDHLLMKPNGREKTRIGRHSVGVQVSNYDDEEFEDARDELGTLGGGLVHGAQYAPELRAPWVLRSIAATHMQDLTTDKVVVLPPLLGPQMFAVADDRFSELGGRRDDLKRLASLYLEDLNSSRRDGDGDALSRTYLFSVREELVRKGLERDSIRDLLQAGLIRRDKAYSGDTVYVVRVPELFALEVASRIAGMVSRQARKGADNAAKWLITRCSKMPLGDAIGAHAMSMALSEMGGALYLELINGLLKHPPRRERLVPGSRMVTLMPSLGLIDMEIDSDGNVFMSHRGSEAEPVKIEIDDDNELTKISSMDGWLILSQMTQCLVLIDEDGEVFNASAPLLLELGTCPEILRRPGRNLEGFHTHEIEGCTISCFQNGIAEPVTWAITGLLVNDIPGVDRNAWVKEAANRGSAPLTNRLGQALTHISKLQGMEAWAKEMLENYYKPALAGQLQQLH